MSKFQKANLTAELMHWIQFLITNLFWALVIDELKLPEVFTVLLLANIGAHVTYYIFHIKRTLMRR